MKKYFGAVFSTQFSGFLFNQLSEDLDVVNQISSDWLLK